MKCTYCCPNCKTNRTRFNIIEQEATMVKVDPNTGEIVEQYSAENKDPFHLPYDGPERNIQCAACGLIETEEAFIKYAQYRQKLE